MSHPRYLTFEDLLQYCRTNKLTRFNATQEIGSPLSVQIPTTFQVESVANDNTDNPHRGMLRLKFRIFHDGLNRNGSFVSKEAGDLAAPTIADRPILATIHQLDDGTWDFHAHDMTIEEDDDGECSIQYIEKQVGSFSSEPTFWEYDKKTHKNYLCAYGYIPEEYTKTADIIRNKKGWTKNSCELQIEEMSYNAKDKYLELTKFYVSASTLLGADDDGTQIEEGMLGSRADIVDFSQSNNSIQYQIDNEVKAYIEASIYEVLHNINSQGKEEPQVNKELFESLLAKYQKTAEEVTFEYAELNDEELEKAFAEAFAETTSTDENSEDTTVEPETVENTSEDGENAENTDTTEDTVVENFTKTFELSHSDIRSALYALLAPFEESDNEWYGITNVYDDHFIYQGWCSSEHLYDQKYTRDGDNIAFDGDRVHMNVEFLTDNELVALNEMRSNYAKFEEVSAKLAKYEAEPKKMEIFESPDYSNIASTEEFTELKKRENHFDLTVEEVKSKCDAILLDYAKKTNFSATQQEKKTHSVPILKTPTKVAGRYGHMFD